MKLHILLGLGLILLVIAVLDVRAQQQEKDDDTLYLKPEHLFTHAMIPSLSEQQWNQLKRQPNREHGVHCGSHHEEQSRHKRLLERAKKSDFDTMLIKNDAPSKKKTLPKCAETVCGIPQVRDRYLTMKKKHIVKIDWIFTKSSPHYRNAKQTVSQMMYLLRSVFRGTDIEFRSRIRIYGLSDRLAARLGTTPENLINFKVHKYNCKDREDGGNEYCVEAEKLLNAVSGTKWREIGALQILAVDFTREVLNGFGKFPWSRLHGMMAIAHHALVKGATTLPHEMGHVFGLLHTFTGYQRGQCAMCTERSPNGDDHTGDLISDTPPMPLFHPSIEMGNCEQPANSQQYPPSCMNPQWKKDSNYNIMSYGSCRNHLTRQQAARMQCFMDRVIKRKFWVDNEDDPSLDAYKRRQQ